MTRPIVDGAVKCPDCQRWLALTAENWSFKKKTGRPHSYCRACASARSTAWYLANPERANAARATYKKANPERYREYSARHRRENEEHCRRVWRAWRDRNAESVRAKERAYYRANRNKYREASRAWCKANPEKARLMLARKNARRRGAPIEGEAKEYAKILLADPCVYCGSRERPSIDHIVPLVHGGDSSWHNLAACCARCNSQKAHTSVLRQLVRRLTA